MFQKITKRYTILYIYIYIYYSVCDEKGRRQVADVIEHQMCGLSSTLRSRFIVVDQPT